MNKRSIDTKSGNQIQDLIDSNPNLYFEENVFAQACADIEQASEAEHWSRNLGLGSTVDDILAEVPDELKAHFLRLYIGRFEKVLTV